MKQLATNTLFQSSLPDVTKRAFVQHFNLPEAPSPPTSRTGPKDVDVHYIGAGASSRPLPPPKTETEMLTVLTPSGVPTLVRHQDGTSVVIGPVGDEFVVPSRRTRRGFVSDVSETLTTFDIRTDGLTTVRGVTSSKSVTEIVDIVESAVKKQIARDLRSCILNSYSRTSTIELLNEFIASMKRDFLVINRTVQLLPPGHLPSSIGHVWHVLDLIQDLASKADTYAHAHDRDRFVTELRKILMDIDHLDEHQIAHLTDDNTTTTTSTSTRRTRQRTRK